MKFKAILGAAVVLGTMMFASVTVHAATTYKVGAVNGEKGGEVTLPISVVSSDGNDMLNGFIVELKYDATMVLPVQNQNDDDEALLSLYGSTPLTEGVFVADRLEAGKGTSEEKLAIAWAAASNHKVSKTGEVLANVTFKVAENVTADSIPVYITVKQVATDANTLDTTFEASAGSIDLASILYGDADGDGLVTSGDATRILQHIAKVPGKILEGTQLQAADVDGSEGVTSGDATTILMYLAKDPSVPSLPVVK